MAIVSLTDTRGGQRSIARDALTVLGSGLDGSILFPEDSGFDEATRIWNALAAKRPGVVVQALSTRDVSRTVMFAADNGLELSVKGGGHNIAGLALSDGGMTLDLGQMRTVEVDPVAQRAAVGPGCTLGDVDQATQAHGLATTLGFVSETGAAGLTLGGGFGYLTRQFGWTVDDLEEVEIVTADGRVLRASRDQHRDLFWALRGGGGNFGVATEFVYRLHRLGPDVTAGIIAWPAEQAETILRLFEQITTSAPRELTMAVLMRYAPPAPWLPQEAHGTPIVAIVACHTGSADAAQRDLEPIKGHGGAWADLIQVRPYVAQQSLLDATQPAGNNYYWKSEYVSTLSDGLLERYRALFNDGAGPANQIILFHIAGALQEHPQDDGAVGNRDAGYACVLQAMWPPGQSENGQRDWVQSAWKALATFSTGGNYVNFQTDDETDERTQDAYGANLARLRQVKARHDPTNLFHVNRNIEPGARS